MAAATLVACGGGTTTPSDAGPTGDTGTDTGTVPGDGGPRDGGGGMGACGTAEALRLMPGAQTVMGNTMGGPNDVSLGATCGGQMAGDGPTAPEHVYAITLPGTSSDRVSVSYTTVNSGTNMMFDTTTQVRPMCSSATNAVCWDDTDPRHNEYRSTGYINGMGGTTQYLIVSGYRVPLMGYSNSGPYQLDFHTYVNPTAPTFTMGDATLVDGHDLTIHVTGMDPQSSALGLAVSFLDATGTAIGIHTMGAGMPAVTDLGPYDFQENLSGMMTFTGTVHTADPAMWPAAEVAMATQVRVAIIDGAFLQSMDAMIPLTIATTVHVGDACDATHVCPATTTCTMGVCTISSAVATACMGAQVVSTLPFTATGVTLGTGMGALDPDTTMCVNAGGVGGDEHIFQVTVPATGTYDLLAVVPPNGEMGADTVVYDRTVCGDPTTETGCNDDASAMPHVIASNLVVMNAAPGMHFVVLDAFGTLRMSETADITISLRDVVASGMPCDPMGVTSRCATGTCPTTGTAVCP